MSEADAHVLALAALVAGALLGAAPAEAQDRPVRTSLSPSYRTFYRILRGSPEDGWTVKRGIHNAEPEAAEVSFGPPTYSCSDGTVDTRQPEHVGVVPPRSSRMLVPSYGVCRGHGRVVGADFVVSSFETQSDRDAERARRQEERQRRQEERQEERQRRQEAAAQRREEERQRREEEAARRQRDEADQASEPTEGTQERAATRDSSTPDTSADAASDGSRPTPRGSSESEDQGRSARGSSRRRRTGSARDDSSDAAGEDADDPDDAGSSAPPTTVQRQHPYDRAREARDEAIAASTGLVVALAITVVGWLAEIDIGDGVPHVDLHFAGVLAPGYLELGPDAEGGVMSAGLTGGARVFAWEVDPVEDPTGMLGLEGGAEITHTWVTGVGDVSRNHFVVQSWLHGWLIASRDVGVFAGPLLDVELSEAESPTSGQRGEASVSAGVQLGVGALDPRDRREALVVRVGVTAAPAVSLAVEGGVNALFLGLWTRIAALPAPTLGGGGLGADQVSFFAGVRAGARAAF